MEKSVLMGGFGGQGVQTCGKLLIYAANEEDKIATFYSQYGGAMRGGTSNCTVITSDEEIGAPNKKIVDTFLATEFEGGRHAKRLAKLLPLERTGA